MKNKDVFLRMDNAELLSELLLLAGLRKNTEEVSALLIEKFGCPENVISAPFQALSHVDMLGEKYAHTINLLRKLPLLTTSVPHAGMEPESVGLTPKCSVASLRRRAGRLLLSRLKSPSQCEDCAFLAVSQIGDFSELRIFKGKSKGSVQYDFQPILETALFFDADVIFIAHLHTDGKEASERDIAETAALREILADYRITLAGHFIYIRGTDGKIKTEIC